MAKIGVGIIGAGGIAGSHAEAYRTFPDQCEVVAFSDIVPGKADASARQYGAKAGYTDVRDMLKRPDIQLVSVCTPPFEHAAGVIAAAQAGKHVLCEKPMAGSPSECDAMIAAAKAAGVKLGVVFQYRFDPAVRRARALLASGRIGRPVLAVLNGLWWRGPAYYEVWWRGTWVQECGGALLNHHCHLVDVLLHLLGEPASVTADIDATSHDIEVEDTALVNVRFASGVLASMVATVSAHNEATRLEISAEGAGLAISIGSPLVISVRKPDGGGFPEVDSDTATALAREAEAGAAAPAFQGHAAVIEDMLAAVRDGRPPAIPGEEGRRTVDLIMAAYKAATLGSRERLPMAPGDPFYSREGLKAKVWKSPRIANRKAGGMT